TFFTEPPLPQELLLPSPGFEPSLGKEQPTTTLPKGVRKRRSTHQTVVTPCTSVGDQPHGSADHQPVVLRRPTSVAVIHHQGAAPQFGIGTQHGLADIVVILERHTSA